MSDSLRPRGPQYTRPPCPSPTSRAYSNSSINSIESVMPSSHLISVSPSVLALSLPQHQSFLTRQTFASGGQSIGVSASASVLPMNIQDCFPLGWTGLISLQSKGLSRVFSNTAVQKHQFFSAQLSLESNSHIHTWPLEKTIALTRQTLVGKVKSLLFSMLSRLVKFFFQGASVLQSMGSQRVGHNWVTELNWTKQVALVVKNLPPNAGDIRDVGLIPGESPWTEEPGRLHSIESQS